MRLLAIDPGTRESAWVVWDGRAILAHGKELNEHLGARITVRAAEHDACCVEMVASFGMPVGAEVFETVYWIGRFAEAFDRSNRKSERASRLTRNEIKNHLCHSSRAKDANIRQAIIDRLGAPGTKKVQGATYGLAGDEWSALAVAITYWDKYVTGGQLFERPA